MVAMQGRPWGGRPPFGYHRDPNDRSYVVDEKHAWVVREIFDRYESGHSQWRIACDLNDEDIRRPSGAECWLPPDRVSDASVSERSLWGRRRKLADTARSSRSY